MADAGAHFASCRASRTAPRHADLVTISYTMLPGEVDTLPLKLAAQLPGMAQKPHAVASSQKCCVLLALEPPAQLFCVAQQPRAVAGHGRQRCREVRLFRQSRRVALEQGMQRLCRHAGGGGLGSVHDQGCDRSRSPCGAAELHVEILYVPASCRGTYSAST